MVSGKPYDVKDLKLAAAGKNRVEWAKKDMPVLRFIGARFAKEKPLEGVRIAACLHVTTETAALMQVLAAGGAKVALCASNPLSTQDEAAASLVKNDGITVYAIKGENRKTYYRHILAALAAGPHMTMDDGADLVSMVHSEKKEYLKEIVGGTEETTTGVIRLSAMGKKGILRYPIIAVNEAKTKHFFDNRYGTGQSTIDGIVRATNILLAGTTFVVTLALAPNIQYGILTGIILSLALFLFRTMTPRIVLLGLDEHGHLQNAEKYNLPRFHPKVIAIRFDGQLYFANVSYFEQSVVNLVSKDPSLRYLLVDSRGINGLDASGVEMLRGLVDRLRSNGIELAFCNIKGPVVEVMLHTGLLDKIGKERVFLTEQAALEDFEKRLAGETDLPAPAN